MSITRPPGEAHAAYGMAALLVAGGVFAMVKRGSVKSLIPSVVFASGYVFAAERLRQGEGAQGHRIAAALGLGLGTAMVIRAGQTKKLYPAGIVGVLGLVSGGYHAYKWKLWTE